MESIGVFDEELGRKKDMLLSNEELGLIQEIGTHKSVYYLPKAMIFHHVMAYRLNKKYILERSFWQGISNVIIEKPISYKNIIYDIKNLIKLVRIRILHSSDISRLSNYYYYYYFKGRVYQEIRDMF